MWPQTSDLHARRNPTSTRTRGRSESGTKGLTRRTRGRLEIRVHRQPFGGEDTPEGDMHILGRITWCERPNPRLMSLRQRRVNSRGFISGADGPGASGAPLARRAWGSSVGGPESAKSISVASSSACWWTRIQERCDRPTGPKRHALRPEGVTMSMSRARTPDSKVRVPGCARFDSSTDFFVLEPSRNQSLIRLKTKQQTND